MKTNLMSLVQVSHFLMKSSAGDDPPGVQICHCHLAGSGGPLGSFFSFYQFKLSKTTVDAV